MHKQPYDIIYCSWPQPVEQRDGVWRSEPEWNSPPMPYHPQPNWEMINGELCWTIDWRETFKNGLKVWERHLCGEMRGFSIIFHLRINGSGTLVFWDDDGCIIRRNGIIVHYDKNSHMLQRHQIEVKEGDYLEISQWQLIGGWLWGARLEQSDEKEPVIEDVLLSYLDSVQQRLLNPSGPALKMYTNGANPVRTVVSLYSMILNGYAPSEILLFGENDWNQQARAIFTTMLPFARIISREDVINHIRNSGQYQLVERARNYWYVMKTCISLLYPPEEFCLMDDDVFILDCVDDALSEFQQCDLVFAPDTDHGRHYLAAWGWMHRQSSKLKTGVFNAGLYWMRNKSDQKKLARYMMRIRPASTTPFVWEQGFIANLFADKKTCQLPTQRYFYPLFDGLPGGILGYDYKLNPCRFASIHFGGLTEKPGDEAMPYLAASILGRFQKSHLHYQTITAV